MSRYLPRPNPPFAEIGFYAQDRSDAQLMSDLLGALARAGAVSNGWGLAHRWDGPPTGFGGPTDCDQYGVRIADLESVEVETPGQRIVSVEVGGVFRYDPNHQVIVTFLQVDLENEPGDHHPIAIWSSGDHFSGPTQPGTRKTGLELREVFTSLVGEVQPNYGAVTVEWPLVTPHEIGEYITDGWRYGDFFVARDYVGDSGIDEVEEAAAGLDVERTSDGIFVFSYEEFGGTGGDYTDAAKALARVVSRQRYRNVTFP